eukprot:937456-Pleurochrysis_carterae.AAC.1
METRSQRRVRARLFATLCSRVSACVRACVRARARARMRVWACVCVREREREHLRNSNVLNLARTGGRRLGRIAAPQLQTPAERACSPAEVRVGTFSNAEMLSAGVVRNCDLCSHLQSVRLRYLTASARRQGR